MKSEPSLGDMAYTFPRGMIGFVTEITIGTYYRIIVSIDFGYTHGFFLPDEYLLMKDMTKLQKELYDVD